MGKRSDADHRTSQDAPIAAAHICSCLCHASVQVVCVVVWFQCVRVCDLLTTFCVNHGKVNDRQDVKRVPLKCPNMVAAGPLPQRKKKFNMKWITRHIQILIFLVSPWGWETQSMYVLQWHKPFRPPAIGSVKGLKNLGGRAITFPFPFRWHPWPFRPPFSGGYNAHLLRHVRLPSQV